MPTVRQPRAFDKAANALPTAPVAALTTIVCPALGSIILTKPYHAVTPGMPTAPRYALNGMCVVSTFRNAPNWVASTTLYCCQPPMPTTLSPTLNLSFCDSTTSPTVPPPMVWPSAWGTA